MNAPPLLVQFPDRETFFTVLQDSKEEHVLARLMTLNLPPVSNLETLSVLFSYSPRFLSSIRKRPSRYYREFSIAKGHRRRMISSPRVALKVIQKWFGHHVARAIELDASVHGFVPGSSCITAAAVHCGTDWILGIDLRDFFHSVTTRAIADSLEKIGFPAPSVDTMLPLLTLAGALPQGAPSSPVLSNLAFSSFDAKLRKLAECYGVNYTRYADDIVFSGAGSPPRQLLARAKGLIETDWVIADDKTHLSIRPARLSVHGLVVNGPSPRLPREYRNKVRRMRYSLESTHIKLDDKTRKRFAGHIAFANAVQNFRS